MKLLHLLLFLSRASLNHGFLLTYIPNEQAGPLSSVFMGDHSSATRFQVGDSVMVVDDVLKMGRNLKGLAGIVVETWEKCDVDRT